MNPFINRRESVGISLIDFPEEFVVLDIETSGLDPIYDSIIEIGAIRYNKGIEVNRFSELIKPEEYIQIDEEDNKETEDYLIIEGQPAQYISDFISKLTGISNKMLDNARKAKEVLTDFNEFISDDIIVGHNVDFDINFLYESFEENLKMPLKNNYIDTKRIAIRLLDELKNYGLKDLAEYYGVSYSGAHRALNDCVITFKCFLGLRDTVIERYKSIEEFKKFAMVEINIPVRDIVTTRTSFDEEHPLFGKVCVFTGKLDKMSRRDAMQLVADVGGINSNIVTEDTNYLIMGNDAYWDHLKDNKSNKKKKAEELILKGIHIAIISEDVFYEMVGGSVLS